jgi:GNAT superfamily N-acetyltransferase
MLRIREFDNSDHDYEAGTAVYNRAFPDNPITAEQWRHYAENRDPRVKVAIWLGENDGKVITECGYDQSSGAYDPDIYRMNLEVDPDFQGRSIGSRMFAHMLADLQTHAPKKLETRAREDMVRSTRFLADRGFVEEMRDWESRLDPATLNLSDWQHYPDRLPELEIDVLTYDQLLENSDPARRVHNLVFELMQDVPLPTPPVWVEHEQWRRRFVDAPEFIPEANYFAVKDGELIGHTGLWRNMSSAEKLNTGLTGVKRDWRGKGIATALKVHSYAYAQKHETRCIITHNESTNRDMLRINERFGFVKQPAWIWYKKEFGE